MSPEEALMLRLAASIVSVLPAFLGILNDDAKASIAAMVEANAKTLDRHPPGSVSSAVEAVIAKHTRARALVDVFEQRTRNGQRGTFVLDGEDAAALRAAMEGV